ncbi:uncharacterized protein LOC141909766 isoform X2 [Tubulanus polymorphus]|uniref:uncharacterized protein LOC141909766 isoform X2 n=1 Tax=Tubulanus polymorphus TaxID=672921 RepID=UPI003DA2C3C5
MDRKVYAGLLIWLVCVSACRSEPVNWTLDVYTGDWNFASFTGSVSIKIYGRNKEDRTIYSEPFRFKSHVTFKRNKYNTGLISNTNILNPERVVIKVLSYNSIFDKAWAPKKVELMRIVNGTEVTYTFNCYKKWMYRGDEQPLYNPTITTLVLAKREEGSTVQPTENATLSTDASSGSGVQSKPNGATVFDMPMQIIIPIGGVLVVLLIIIVVVCLVFRHRRRTQQTTKRVNLNDSPTPVTSMTSATPEIAVYSEVVNDAQVTCYDVNNEDYADNVIYVNDVSIVAPPTGSSCVFVNDIYEPSGLEPEESDGVFVNDIYEPSGLEPEQSDSVFVNTIYEPSGLEPEESDSVFVNTIYEPGGLDPGDVEPSGLDPSGLEPDDMTIDNSSKGLIGADGTVYADFGEFPLDGVTASAGRRELSLVGEADDGRMDEYAELDLNRPAAIKLN